MTESVWQARLAGLVDELALHEGFCRRNGMLLFGGFPGMCSCLGVIGCSPANEDGLKEGFVLDADHDADKWLRLVYSDRVLMVVLEEEPNTSHPAAGQAS